MHCERIKITQAHRPGGITPRRGLLLPCRVGAVGLVYAVGRSVGRCTAFLCCRRVVYPCTVPGVLWAVCGAVGVALRRRPTFLPKKDFYRFFQGIRDRTPPGTVQSHQHRENTSDFITHFQANFSDFPGLVLFPPA